MLLVALLMAPVRSLVLGPSPPAAPRSSKLDDEPHDMRRGIQYLRQNAVLANDTVVYPRGGQAWSNLGIPECIHGAVITLLTTIFKGVLAECKIVTKPDLESSQFVLLQLIGNVSQQVGGLETKVSALETKVSDLGTKNECSGSRIRWACSRIRLDERLFGRAHRPL